MGTKSLWRILCLAFIISLGGSFHLGYQVSVVNQNQESFKKFINSSYESHYGHYLTETQWSHLWPSIVNAQLLGCFIGTFFTRFLVEKVGRKNSFYVSNLTFLLACMLQGISKFLNSWEAFMIGRFISGIAEGMQVGLQPVYFEEISPKSKRGLVGSMTGIMLDFGLLSASILALPVILGSETRWPCLLLIEAVPSVMSLIILPFLPESPKYLANRGDDKGAKVALRYFGLTEEEAIEELEEIRQELDVGSESMSIKNLFAVAYIRKGIFLGWAVIFSSAYNGSIALAYFSADILESTGLSAQIAGYATIGIMAPSILGTCFSGFILDWWGRRPIILASNLALLLLNVLFIIFAHVSRAYSLTWAAYVNIAVLILINFASGLGSNAVWFLSAELVPQKARSSVHILAMALQFVAIGSSAFIVYPIKSAIDEFSFLIYIIPLMIFTVYFALALPETKNKSTLEIVRQLGYREEHDGAMEHWNMKGSPDHKNAAN